MFPEHYAIYSTGKSRVHLYKYINTSITQQSLYTSTYSKNVAYGKFLVNIENFLCITKQQNLCKRIWKE